MANEFLSLLDVTSRQGTDQAVGLVEEVITYAPEMERIMGRPIPGTHYTARVRTAYTANSAFRKANAGVSLSASAYTPKRFECFFFDTQLQVDEAVARASEQDGDSLAALQFDEATGAVRAKAIAFGKQFYQGTSNDPNGFTGLIDFLANQANTTDPTTGAAVDQTVTAGGSGSGCERVWMVWNHPQGVHFLFGGNQGLDIKPWTQQQVPDLNDSTKRLMAWVSTVSGYGPFERARAVGRLHQEREVRPRWFGHQQSDRRSDRAARSEIPGRHAADGWSADNGQRRGRGRLGRAMAVSDVARRAGILAAIADGDAPGEPGSGHSEPFRRSRHHRTPPHAHREWSADHRDRFDSAGEFELNR